MILKSNENFYVVGKNEYVIKSGSRSGEVITRLTISNGLDLYRDIQVGNLVKTDNLILFTQPYAAEFEYSERIFNDKVYKTFSVSGLTPVK